MKMFQINENDLMDLERLMPILACSLSTTAGPRERTSLRRIKGILSDVRWDYGPHEDTEVIPAE